MTWLWLSSASALTGAVSRILQKVLLDDEAHTSETFDVTSSLTPNFLPMD